MQRSQTGEGKKTIEQSIISEIEGKGGRKEAEKERMMERERQRKERDIGHRDREKLSRIMSGIKCCILSKT